MNILIASLILASSAFSSSIQKVDNTYIDSANVVYSQHSEPVERSIIMNNWGAICKSSNFHVGLDIQTKYVWRGMEMITDSAAPVLFPVLNYQWNNLYVYAMGGYAINGKYVEVDMGFSYTWHGLTIGVNDYYYPTVTEIYDEYFGGTRNGHWLEACLTYSPDKVPIWITASNFFCGDDDIYLTSNVDVRHAYSTYFEVGTYYSFLDSNKLSLAVGMTPSASCYNGYINAFSVCNIDLKYTYNWNVNSSLVLPLSVEVIYNPIYDKPHINFIVNFAL